MATTPEALAVSAQRLLTVNYVGVASCTLVFFDYSLTFASEIDLIWRSKLNFAKVLYFLSRYPAFADVIISVYFNLSSTVSVNLCGTVNNVGTWLILYGISVAEVILLMRTAALWGHDKRVVWGLSGLYVSNLILCTIFTHLYLRSLSAAPPPFPAITHCFLIGGNPLVFINFVLLIAYETVVVGLTTYKWYTSFRGSANPMILTLYRDGILFYICLFSISVANGLVLGLGPVEYSGLITTFQRVMHSLLSCRILLHVREADRARRIRFV